MTAIRTVHAMWKAKAGPWGGAGIFGAVIAVLIALQERSRRRQHLRQLDDRLLLDVGMSKKDIRLEAEKSIWRS